ncbi:MAG: mechanosensitive ion channel [Gemmatimonadota bacterium]|nr:mechanosensitive ion channel [Gemmatimonadota bacterium]
MTFGQLPDWVRSPAAERLFAALVTVVIIALLARMARAAIVNRVADVDSRYRAVKLVRFTAFVVGAIALATIFSQRLASFTVAFGVAGAGIAFALQEVIASVAGWLAVLSGGFYKTGDRVQLGGIKGDVIDIGVLRTTLMECGQWVDGDLYNGRIVKVANSFVFKEPVVNYTGDFPFLWDEIKVPVRYGSDRARVRQILERAASELTSDAVRDARGEWARMVRNYRIEEARLDPLVTLIANDNWLEYTVRYVVDFRRRRAMKDYLFTRILDDIEATKGAVQLASATFELVGAPPVRVQLDSATARSAP